MGWRYTGEQSKSTWRENAAAIMSSLVPGTSAGPSFRIGEVASITGVSEATLRMWERRYHFPCPTRARGGQRQYSQHEVLRVQWVKMHLDEGMRPGAAIRAQHLSNRRAAVSASLHIPLPIIARPDPDVVALQSGLQEALLSYDGARAVMILSEAVALHPVRDVVLDLVGPVLSAIGDAWSSGDVEVAREHFATHILRHQLLAWMRACPAPYDVRPIALACPPEELHEGSLLMLGALLRQRRWPVVYLGQSLPLADMAVLADAAKPALIVFAAMSEATALALAEWPKWLDRDAATRPPIVGYGGRAFIEHRALVDHVPGVLLGSTLDEGYRRIHRLMLDLNVLQD